MGFLSNIKGRVIRVRDYSKRKLMSKFYSEKMGKLETRYNSVIEDVVKVCNERIIGLGDIGKLSDEGLLMNATGYNNMYEIVKSIGGDEVKQLKNNVQTLNKMLTVVTKHRKAIGQDFPFSGVDDKRAKVMFDGDISKVGLPTEEEKTERLLNLLNSEIKKCLEIKLDDNTCLELA